MNSQSTARNATESAVVVPVPEAEHVVRRYRTRLDPTAVQGMPAHVTILYPFVQPDAITDVTIETLATAVGSVAAFDCEFSRTNWFREEVLWLAPEPDGPFQALTSAVLASFPGFPPYGGAYDAVPHLTVGQQPASGVRELRAAEADLQRSPPIRARVARAWLMTGSTAPDTWRAIVELPLAASYRA